MYAATNAYASSAYQNVATSSGVAAADPHGLVSLLLGGAIERAGAARVALMNADYAQAASKIGAAGVIVAELRSCLDHDQGGELAGELENLYDYVQRRLLHANRRRDQEALLECMDLLSQIYAAWLDIGQR